MIPVPKAVVERKARSPRKNLGPYGKILVKNIYTRNSREMGVRHVGLHRVIGFYPFTHRDLLSHTEDISIWSYWV